MALEPGCASIAVDRSLIMRGERSAVSQLRIPRPEEFAMRSGALPGSVPAKWSLSIRLVDARSRELESADLMPDPRSVLNQLNNPLREDEALACRSPISEAGLPSATSLLGYILESLDNEVCFGGSLENDSVIGVRAENSPKAGVDSIPAAAAPRGSSRWVTEICWVYTGKPTVSVTGTYSMQEVPASRGS
jgi:hypothetical protein